MLTKDLVFDKMCKNQAFPTTKTFLIKMSLIHLTFVFIKYKLLYTNPSYEKLKLFLMIFKIKLKEFSHYAREYGKKLFIYYLREEDAGDYECYLDNGQSNLIHLMVRAKPTSEEKYQETGVTSCYI